MFEVPGADMKTVYITEESVQGGTPDYIRRPSTSANTPTNDPNSDNSTFSSTSNSTDEGESIKGRASNKYVLATLANLVLFFISIWLWLILTSFLYYFIVITFKYLFLWR